MLLSSSGGGLFDGRPKTQTWVWGAFVLPPETHAIRRHPWRLQMGIAPDAGNSGIALTRSREACVRIQPRRKQAWTSGPSPGQCPFGCANPKACTSSAEAANFRTSGLGVRLSAIIHAGYGDFRVQPEVRQSSRQLFPKWNRPSLPQAFHRLWKRSCSPIYPGKPYSGDPMPSWAMDSKRVDRLTKASLIRPVGPLRCLAMMISATPSSSGSSGL